MYLIYGTIGIFLITFFIGYVYLKKSKYGIVLLIVSLLIISFSIYWNLSQHSRDLKESQRIPLDKIAISNQKLSVAYGNRYLFQAELQNQSSSSQLNSVELQLSKKNDQQIVDEKMTNWIKVWLSAEKSQQIKMYFSSKKLAKELSKNQWSVKVIATKSR